MSYKSEELVEYITTSIFFDKTTLESEQLSSEIWEKYLGLSNGKKIRKSGDYLLRIGDNLNGCYFIKKGRIKDNLLGKDGNTKTFSITGEGCSYGEQFIFHEQPGLYEALVMEDAELYFFDKDTIIDIMKKDFELNFFLIKSMSIKARMLASQLEDMCIRNIMQNLCKILYTFCCHEKKKNKEKGYVTIYLSHQELADMLASHRVTVTKNLTKLKNQDILDYKYEKIIIKDIQKLKMLAY